MSLHQLGKPLPMLALAFAAFPALLIAGLLSYAFQARLYLGHWPYYAHPDPKELGWWPHHTALQLGFIGYPVVLLGAIVLAVIGRWRSRDFPVWIVILTATVCTTLLIVYGRLDPGGLLNWFWD